MDNNKVQSTVGVSFQKREPNLKTNPPRPIITPREARKVLGGEYKNLSNEELYRVIIGMERLAVLLANNPELFNLDERENNHE